MQFGLINTLVTFQKRINSILEEHLNKFVIVYLNNIVIYFNSKKEYFKYVKWVLQRFIDKKMPIVIKKYKFYMKKTEFYKFIIKPKQLSINLKKIKAVVNW